MTLLLLVLALVAAITLLYRNLPLYASAVAWLLVLCALFGGPVEVGQGWFTGLGSNWIWIALLWLIPLALFGPTPIRRALVTPTVFKIIAPILPVMSDTEKTALDAGSVWWDGDLFSGNPDWKKLLAFRPKELTPEERAFVDGPVETVCSMVTEWGVTQRGDLPPEVWEYLKSEGFFGLIIPKKYGGKGFSAAAHSAVILKLSSRSTVLAVTVMVPNSLGPAELLGHYGTEEQKERLLPRLADGRELPAFALTEPNAGSDAASMTSNGVVCMGQWEGEEVLGIRLNWDKRYITLASVSTLLGLAFKLSDPDGLMGNQIEYGITCALIPTDLPGVVAERRHDPLGVPFFNGPTQGHDVFVPIDFIIGGQKNAGMGWRMLMDCLAAGRGICLPSQACAGGQVATRTTGAYASIRQQFGMSIGLFEGIEEPLARIAGRSYYLDAMRNLTVGAIDAGEKPAVLTAICKRWMTEAMRDVMNDAMDVVGGAGISRGPRNILSAGYTGAPISITVEGANILTRSMIVFGQGAIRCHPFAQKEIDAVAAKDLGAFDRAFFGHVGFIFTNAARSVVLSATGGYVAGVPLGGPEGYYMKQLTRLSASFAIVSDISMGVLGGGLKRMEKMTGRLADVLAWMYMGSAAVHRFRQDGCPERDLPYMRWAAQTALYEAEQALLGVIRNFPVRPAAALMRVMVFPYGPRMTPPSDRLGAHVARGILYDGEARTHLGSGIYIPPADEEGLGRLEKVLGDVIAARPVQRKIREAVSAKKLERKPKATLYERAEEAGIITADDRELLGRAAEERDEVVQVDSFSAEEFLGNRR